MLGTMLQISDQSASGLKLSQRVAYGVGHVLNDISSAMWFSYVVLFFEVVLKMPSSMAGALMFLGQLGDVIASPIAGILVDRYLNRKTWHLLGTLLLAFTYPPIFSNTPWMPDVIKLNSTNETQSDAIVVNSWQYLDSLQMTLGVLYFTLFACIFQTGFAIVQIAHLAIIPDLTPDKSERTNLTAIRWTSNFATNIFVFLVSWLVLHTTEGGKNAIGPGDTYKFKAIISLTYIVGLVCILYFHAVLKIPGTSVTESKSKDRKDLKAWMKAVKEYFLSFQLYQVTAIYCASRMVMCISLIYIPLYLVEEVKNDSELIATVPLVSYIASFLASLWVRQIRKCCTSKVNYIIGTVLSLLGSIWIGWGFTYKEEMYAIASLLGAGSSITGVASLALCATLIGTDTENGGFVYSVVTVVDKLLGGVAVILIEVLKSRYVDSSNKYYQDVLAYTCGVSSIVGLIIVITMYCNPKKSVPSQ